MTQPSDQTALALEATRTIRRSRGYAALDADEQHALERSLRRIEAALEHGRGAPGRFAARLETPLDLRGPGSLSGDRGAPPPQQPAAPLPRPPAGEPPRPPPGTEVIGERARRALEAIDFPSFVASLVHGTFQS